MMQIPKTVIDKLDEGRSYRDIQTPFEVRDAEDAGDEKRVTGYACTFDNQYMLYGWSDYEVWEQIDKHAFDDCDMSDVIMQYNHEGRVFARTNNKTLSLTMDDHGLRIDADLGGTEIGRQLYEEIKGGYTDKMSFGFKVGEDKREVIEDHETGKIRVNRTITKVSKLYDVSAVSLPANDATAISARSFASGLIDEALKEIHEREAKKARIRIMAMK